MRKEGGETKYGCFDDCSHEQHRNSPSRHRGDLRRDHRAGLPGHARKVRDQARSRFGVLNRWGVVVALATATLLALVPTAADAANSGLLNPAPGSQYVTTSDLPDCDANHLNTDGTGQSVLDAAQLGWKAGSRVAVTYGGATAEITPSIPCVQYGYIKSPIIQNYLVGQSNDIAIFGWRATYTCQLSDGSIVTLQDDPPRSAAAYGPPGAVPKVAVSQGYANGLTGSMCPQVASAVMVIYSVTFTNNQPTYTPLVSWQWSPVKWTTAAGGWVPAKTPNDILPPGTELQIVCAIDTTGQDIFTITSNFMASIVRWVPCMLIPVGWDRADKIAAAWSVGPISELVAAYKSAIPHGISCGPVGNIPFFGNVIALDTCSADFAPGWVKSVVGWVIVLAACTVIVRRVMWSVGSRG